MPSDSKVAVLICSRDRPTELALLLQSLRTQTYKNFKVFIVDDCSGTPILNYHFLTCIMSKMNEEGNFITYDRTEFNLGVSKARQKCVDLAIKDGECDLFMRVDDDVILDEKYIESLLEVIEVGYDLASGVTPFIGQPGFKRESKFIKPVADKVILDSFGNIVFNGDDCGMEYYDKAILPLHHFRSCALYKKGIHDKVNYDSNLSKHGFREEQIFSFKCILNGFKLGLNTKAIAWHLLTPSGGERFADSQELVKINEEVMRNFTINLFKEKGDFIADYNKRLGIRVTNNKEEQCKATNCQV